MTNESSRAQRASAWVLAALGLVAACQSKSAGPGGAGGDAGTGGKAGTIANADPTACEQTAGLYCQQLFTCSPEAAKDMYGSLEACSVLDATTCRRLAALAGASPASIDGWAACNRALGARSCADARFSGALAACRLPAGLRKVGEPCTDAAQCATTYCQFAQSEPDGPPTDCGICAPALGVGAACDGAHYCDWDLSCSDDGHCVRLAPAGAACDAPSSSSCEGELVCIGGHCARPLPERAACTDASECDGDLRCLEGRCAKALAAGDACLDGGYDCQLGLWCGGGTCQPTLPAGASCTVNDECSSSTCDGIVLGDGTVKNGRCKADDTPPPTLAAELGEPCSLPDATTPDAGASAACHDYAFCDDTTRRCVLRKPAGEACAGDEQCLFHLACNAGKCQFAEPMCP